MSKLMKVKKKIQIIKKFWKNKLTYLINGNLLEQFYYNKNKMRTKKIFNRKEI